MNAPAFHLEQRQPAGASAPFRLDDADAVPLPALAAQRLQLRRGEHLFQMQQAVRDRLYRIRSGQIKLYQLAPDGRQRIIDFLRDGDWLGADAIGQHEQHACALALGDCDIDAVPYSQLAALLDRQPHSADAFNHMLSRQIARQQQASVMLRVATAGQRIAYFLLQWAGPAAQAGVPAATPLPMSRLDIGDYLGLTPATVSRVMSDFRRRGWLDVQQRCYTLPQRHALELAAAGMSYANPR